MKILFVINGLGGGGAEKVFVDLIRNFDQKKYDITVLAVDDWGIYKYEMRKMVKYHYLMKHEEKEGIKRKWYGFLSVIGRKIIRSFPSHVLYKWFIKGTYDVEIAYIEGEATKILAGSNNRKSVKYAWVHTDMIKNPWTEKIYKNVEIEKKDYQKFNRIMAVSESVKEAFEKKYGISADVMYNALDDREIVEKAKDQIDTIIKNESLCIVTVGGLREVKGFLRLLKVINRLQNEKISVQLVIIGEGSEREKLERYIQSNGLEEKVLLYGFTTNPYSLIIQGDLYVCSSFAEGFSTSVTEALILGVPVLTTECAGMRELLGDSEYGMIVENSEEGLYNGIKYISENPDVLKKMKQKSRERGKVFTIQKRIKELEKVIWDDYQKSI